MLFLDDNDILSILPNRILNFKENSHPIKSLGVLKDKKIGKIMTQVLELNHKKKGVPEKDINFFFFLQIWSLSCIRHHFYLFYDILKLKLV